MAQLVVRRPPAGTRGERFSATTNSFKVESLPKKTFYHYDAVLPEVRQARRITEIVQRLQEANADVFSTRAAFDGRANLFSSIRLFTDGERRFDVNMGNPNRPVGPNARGGFTVAIKLVAEIHPNALDAVLHGQRGHTPASLTALQLLNVMVRHVPIMGHPHNSRSFFIDQPTNVGIYEIWPGFFQSVRPSPQRMLVNVDISTAVMYRRGPLIEMVLQFLGLRDTRHLEGLHTRMAEWTRLKSFLKRLLVDVDGRTKSISELVEQGAMYQFEKEGRNGEPPEHLTVEEYYRRFRKVQIKYPKIPAIRSGRNAVIPMELCFVKPGQFYRKRAPPEVTAAMIEKSRPQPGERIKKIMQGLQSNALTDNPYLRESGMQIAAQPEQVNGRILSPPELHYGGQGSQVIKPNVGAWNVRDQQFFQAVTIKYWSVICFNGSTDQRDIQTFVKTMVQCMTRRGMVVQRVDPPIIKGNAQGDIERQMQTANDEACRGQDQKSATIIFVILPDSAADIRKAVKHYGDVVSAVPTQCIRAQKVKRANDQYCNNVALKVNVKIGGVNAITKREGMVWIGSQPTMVVGADVTHAAPGVQRPSVAGVVSSVDEYASQYVATCRVQEVRSESISELEAMMMFALGKFNKYQTLAMKRNIWPAAIIFFRDGVSEGEFDQVAELEIPQIQSACARIWHEMGVKSNLPKLTFIVVGKRHHVRFFPNSRDRADKSGNCPAGFVVDTGITNPTVFDFFLQSHSGLLGTSRPGHYIVLKDDNGFDSDKLQAIAYALCYVYARATRSVSIPAPVYYADIVCARADYHFESHLHFSDEHSDIDGRFDLERWRAGFSPSRMEEKMYFV